MATITLTNFAFPVPPSGNQTVKVSWRKLADADVPGSYTNLPDATVAVNGDILSPSPYTITGLPQTSIVIKATNQCGGAGLQKTFINCEPVSVQNKSIVGQCAPGYTLSADGTYCYMVQTQAAVITNSGYCVKKVALNVWNNAGSRIYNAVHDSIVSWLTNTSQFTALTTVPQWFADGVATGPMNRSAVWIDSDCDGVVDALAPGVQVTLATVFNNTGPARTIYVGVSGDNNFVLKVNNVLVAQSEDDTSAFKIFHIFPVEVQNGTNYFNIVGTGDGSTGDGVAMILYDNTKEELIDATSDEDLNIIFSSDSLDGQTIDVATCNPGFNLDTSGGAGHYICKKITVTNPT